MALRREEFIREYTRAVRGGNAAVFGGAGLSRASGYVNWKELLRPLAEEIGLDIDREKDLLAVAQFYKNRRGGTRGGINQTIVNAFTKSVKLNENILILTRLPIFTYWTTNYDSLIETGLRAANRNPDVKSESEQLPVILPGRDAVVYKMHGDASNPAHAVLTKTDYELYEHRRPLFRTALKSDLVSKVFLFVGFSFEDPNLDDILGQIHSLLNEDVHDHYCFLKRVQEADCSDREEYRCNLRRQELQVENLQQYGIQTVYVDSYGEITDILRCVEAASRMKNVFISGSAAVFPPGWDRSAAETLAGGLAAALVKNGCRVTSGFGSGIGSAVINGALDVIYRENYRCADDHLRLRPFPQNITDPVKREAHWRQYREDILREVGIVVFLFGNKTVETSPGETEVVDADGCMQEFEMAKAMNRAVIPVGSTEYAAGRICGEVRKELRNYPYLAGYIDRLGVETDPDKLISMIVEIVNSFDR